MHRERYRRAREIERIAVVVRDDFDYVGIGDIGGVFDVLLERSHGYVVVLQQAQDGGVNGGRIEHGFVALDVDDDLGVRCGCRFGHAIGSGDVILASHDDAGAEFLSGRADAFVVSGDDYAGEVARLRSPLPDVLEHGFAADRDEGFAGESGGCVPGGNHAKNAERHNRR